MKCIHINIYITDRMFLRLSEKLTLSYKIETRKNITDTDSVVNGELVLFLSYCLQVYDFDGRQIEHCLSDSCESSGGGWLRSMSVDKSVNKAVITEDKGLYRPGHRHVYRTDDTVCI